MSNSYFQFKQFRVEQDRCAMKVSTDACIQGAWTPILPGVKHVLDIGTGTGLLSLMLAQRGSGLSIDAIELDKQAALQAKENVTASPWVCRINVIESDIRIYDTDKQYDLVISNPPFFRNDLLGEQGARNIARHGLSLTYNDLLQSFDRLVSPNGYASILLPYAEFAIWEDILNKNNWQVFSRLVIYPNEQKTSNRVAGLCCRAGAYSYETVEKLLIRAAEGYSDPFKALLAPFYLNL